MIINHCCYFCQKKIKEAAIFQVLKFNKQSEHSDIFLLSIQQGHWLNQTVLQMYWMNLFVSLLKAYIFFSDWKHSFVNYRWHTSNRGVLKKLIPHFSFLLKRNFILFQKRGFFISFLFTEILPNYISQKHTYITIWQDIKNWI